MKQKKVVIAKQDLQKIISEEVQLWKGKQLVKENKESSLTMEHLAVLEQFAKLDPKFATCLSEYRELVGG